MNVFQASPATAAAAAIITCADISQTLATHARYCDDALAKFGKAGIDIDTLATQLQEEGARLFATSWKALEEALFAAASAILSVRVSELSL